MDWLRIFTGLISLFSWINVDIGIDIDVNVSSASFLFALNAIRLTTMSIIHSKPTNGAMTTNMISGKINSMAAPRPHRYQDTLIYDFEEFDV
jgi:hypothetical protein